MTSSHFKTTMKTIIGGQIFLSAILCKCVICSLSSSVIFLLKEIIVHAVYCFSLCKNKAFHSRHCGGLSCGVFVIFTDLEVCAGISRFTENLCLSH